MIDHRKLLILAVSFSLIGVLSLFIYSTTIEPRNVTIGDIDEEMVGNIVRTNGTIRTTRTLSDDSLSMQICDVTSETIINVYFTSDAHGAWDGGNLTPGTTIELCGEVELYGGSLEISVSSADDLWIISPPESNVFELWQVLESLEVLDNMNLTTSGMIYDLVVISSSGNIIGTAFEISEKHDDHTYGLNCIIFDRDVSANFTDGDRVVVSGQLGFYEYKGYWQLVIENIDDI